MMNGMIIEVNEDIISFVKNMRYVCDRLRDNYKIERIDADIEDGQDTTKTTLEFRFENGLHFCIKLDNPYKQYPVKEKLYNHVEQEMKKELCNFIIRHVKR